MALRRQTYRLQTLNRITRAIASELDLDRIVQTVTDAATELTGAQFGAFFYNKINDDGESYALFCLSGVPREAFEKFGLPRNTAIFGPTFWGEGVVRSDNIRNDPRYGLSAPHFGMPKEHPPVTSYLAVPVISRSGKVHGGLFFGHAAPGIFQQELEEIVIAIASHAAIAIDNAQLLENAQKEAERQRQLQDAAARLAAIVESSDDAILSKTLEGTILSWNSGAERLFGYTAEETIGQSVTMLMPENRCDEEPAILARIRKGERIDHYETVRQHKDGSLIEISLTVSPLRNTDGVIIGASKIARDITEKHRAEERQRLLLREMNHRIKNLFALATGMIAISARSAETPAALATAIRDRLSALARAHELTLPDLQLASPEIYKTATLQELLKVILEPYCEIDADRVVVTGTDVSVGGSALTSLALLLNEFATNAAKYGALSTRGGQLKVYLETRDAQICLTWTESGGPPLAGPATSEGFGTTLERATIRNQLHGSIKRTWRKEGLIITLSVALDRLS